MNCKPIGMNYFALLKDRVIDGTSCVFPVDFVQQNHSGRAMCVDGVCKVSSKPIFDTRKLNFMMMQAVFRLHLNGSSTT